MKFVGLRKNEDRNHLKIHTNYLSSKRFDFLALKGPSNYWNVFAQKELKSKSYSWSMKMKWEDWSLYSF